MNRGTFLRWLGAALVSGWWLQGGGQPLTPAMASELPEDVAAREIPPDAVDALAAADRAVDAAYKACADGGWAPAQQQRYLRAAMNAARTWRAHAPWDDGGRNYLRLMVDLATDVGWDPGRASPADRALMAEAARYTCERPNGEQHPARARALLAKLGAAR